MISDGFPTECSLEALRSLVRTLSQRYGMVLAQVAVDGMDEDRSAFPDFVDLSDMELHQSVAEFGRLIHRLVARRYGL